VDINDEDAGLATRGELDDAETKREVAGLLTKSVVYSTEIPHRSHICDK
jgi:hypothetical protein